MYLMRGRPAGIWGGHPQRPAAVGMQLLSPGGWQDAKEAQVSAAPELDQVMSVTNS